ncbi:uncharacterized protein LOC129408401 [Boleophthalmus pectinirostris]|uniref:uncharacterized protein LOC129408401 n=1 Tax=Boleophthalmus pectinirostris TaxID=150288 RepID=UPI00242D1ED2|nr:uncharacterized protein LOC129408401 [Boleophthalmus pectinirostris]
MAHLSDGRRQVLRRSDDDLAWMMKRLVDCFPDDRDTLSNQLLSGLLKVRAAEKNPDPEFKIQEINKLLTTIIHLPLKFSQSEPVQTFFGLDLDSRADPDPDPDPDRTQPGLTEDPNQTKDPSETPEEPRVQIPGPDQVLLSLVSHSEVLRCNGFCLANTETVFFDQWERRSQRAGQWERGGRSAGQSEHGGGGGGSKDRR